MQHDNNHIDKKLKQLENQALPDLSRMDEHWKNMQGMLAPETNIPAPKGGNPIKSFRWLIAAVFLGGLSYLTYQLIHSLNHKEKTTVATTGSTAQPLPADTIYLQAKTSDGKDTVLKAVNVSASEQQGNTQPIAPAISARVAGKPGTTIVRLPAKTKNGNTIYPDAAKQTSATQRAVGLINKSTPETPAMLKIKADSLAKSKAALLADFFHALEQQAQQFVIDTRSDTIIAGENGTALFIPANSFTARGHVTITLREYYSYPDIITNKLTTQSGDAQLITGGMVHIIATVDGKEVAIQPGKSIRWFVPDTSASMAQMQLFKGVVQQTLGMAFTDAAAQTLTPRLRSDLSVNPGMIDWVPDGQYFSTNWLETSVKVLDLANNPFKTRTTSKGVVGYFTISNTAKIGKQQLAAELKEKYGYRKVKIRRIRTAYFGRLVSTRIKAMNDLGDSAWVSAGIARTYNLAASDTVTRPRIGFRYESGFKNKTHFDKINLNALAQRFSVDIRELGWINCDKFYGNSRNLDYYVDIGDSPAEYYTVLVFDNMRSMMRGWIDKGRVVFHNIPQGIGAKVICIGVQNGKTVAAIKALPQYGTLINNLEFEETNPQAFKEGISSLDKK